MGYRIPEVEEPEELKPVQSSRFKISMDDADEDADGDANDPDAAAEDGERDREQKDKVWLVRAGKR